ncbi:MAG: hypothetical protein JXA24_07010 [Proteobacteria bacterium]|nr:hypothetical protein [Pseudomonadota bacterium]
MRLGDMMGSAPVLPEAKHPPQPAKAPPPVSASTPPAAPATGVEPIRSTTPDDLNLYRKQGHRDAKWDEFITPAFECFDADRFATAGIFLRKAYELGCRDPLVIFRLAICRESAGDAKLAAELMIEAEKGLASRYPGHPLSQAISKHAGRALYKADRYKEALPHLRKALEREPGDFMLLLMAGQVERMEKNLSEARSLFEKAIASGAPAGMIPDPALTLLRELVILTYELKDFAACEAYVAMVRERDPQDRVAAEYDRRLKSARAREKELEIIKKMVQ